MKMHKIRAEYLGPALRRPLVLEHALHAFSEDGYRAASMASIAERAGVSKSVLYDCFPGGKLEMFNALMDVCLARCATDLAQLDATTPHGLLFQLADAAAGGRQHWSLLMLPAPGCAEEAEVNARRLRSQLLKEIELRLRELDRLAGGTTATWVISEAAVLATIGIALHSEHFGVSADDMGRTVASITGASRPLVVL